MTDWYERLTGHDDDVCNIGWWDEARLRSLVEHPQVVPVLAPRVAGAACLEVCAGRGGNLDLLRAMGAAAALGLDRSPAQLAAVSSQPVLRADALQLPVRTAGSDVVLCVEAAGHLQDLVRFLDECARVIRPGGSLVLLELLADEVLTHIEAVAGDQGLRRAEQVDLTEVVRESLVRWDDRSHPFGPVFAYLDARRDGWAYRLTTFDRVEPPGTVRARPRTRLAHMSRWGARRTERLLREDGGP